MNNALLQDKVFKIYTKLPHCYFTKKKHISYVKKNFDYENLSDISIFAANCIGGEIYSLLGIPFQSPLINISINRDQFIIMCSRLRDYLECPLYVVKVKAGNCVGYLEDEKKNLSRIEIRFPHDTEPAKVKAKWEQRCKRVNYNKLVFIVDDKDLSEKDYKLYNKIEAFRKICFTARDLSHEYSWCHQLSVYEGQKYTGEYNGKSLNGLWKFVKMWDYVSFLNGKQN